MIEPTLKIKNKTQQRIEMINFFYHHFVMNFNLVQTKKFFTTKKQFNLYQQEVINFTFLNFDKIIKIISENLSSEWSFSEISHIEKSILLVAISEYYQGKLSKAIVITEAVKLTKKFSNFIAYRYINKILNNIFDNQTAETFQFQEK